MGSSAETRLPLLKSAVGNHTEEQQPLLINVWEESKRLWEVAGAAIFTRFSTYGVTVISQAYIGHFGQTELAAFALLLTLLTRFSIGILLGMSSGLETLCGQAFGAGQYHMMGIRLQQSWIVLLSTATCLLPLFIFAKPIFILLGQTESVSQASASMSLWFIPVIYSYAFSFSLQTYLQSQRKNKIIGYLAGVSLLLHVSLSWLTAYKLGMGVKGVLISMNLAYWIPNIGQLLFVLCGGCPMTWCGFSTGAFCNLWPVIKLTTSSAVMICLELWYTSVLILLTGNLKNSTIALDALSICLNINGWAMMISLGFLAAASVRVANELGRGRAAAVKFAIKVIVATSTIIGISFFVVFMVFRGSVAYVFTDEQEVVDAVSLLSPLLSFNILLGSVQPVLSGVAVGAGLQALVAYINIACYYLVGIPLGVVLGYVVGLQVEGVWTGMITGTAFQTVLLLFLTWRTDWDQQVSKAKERVDKYGVPHSTATINNDLDSCNTNQNS